MCVAVPMELLERRENKGKAAFSGNMANIDLTLLPNVKKGDFVLVHAGCAIEMIREDEARELSTIFSELERAANE